MNHILPCVLFEQAAKRNAPSPRPSASSTARLAREELADYEVTMATFALECNGQQLPTSRPK